MTGAVKTKSEGDSASSIEIDAGGRIRPCITPDAVENGDPDPQRARLTIGNARPGRMLTGHRRAK